MLQNQINMSQTRASTDAVVDQVASSKREDAKAQRFEQALEKSMQDKRDEQRYQEKRQSRQQMAERQDAAERQKKAQNTEPPRAEQKKSTEHGKSTHSNEESKSAKNTDTRADNKDNSKEQTVNQSESPKAEANVDTESTKGASDINGEQQAKAQKDSAESSELKATSTNKSLTPEQIQALLDGEQNGEEQQVKVSGSDTGVSDSKTSAASHSEEKLPKAEQIAEMLKDIEAKSANADSNAESDQSQNEVNKVNQGKAEELASADMSPTASNDKAEQDETREKVQWLDMVMGLSGLSKETVKDDGVNPEQQSLAALAKSTSEQAIQVKGEQTTDVDELTLEQQIALLQGDVNSSAEQSEQGEAQPKPSIDPELDKAAAQPNNKESKVETELNAITQAINNQTQLNQELSVSTAAEQKTQQLFNALNPAAMQAQSQSQNNAEQIKAAQPFNLDEVKFTEQMLGKGSEEVAKQENTKVLEQQLASTIFNQQSAMSGQSPLASDSGDKNAAVEVMGVQLDRTLVAAKSEAATQVKQDVQIRENILFNKQELANNMQQQVGLMMARNMKSVDIRLDPPELGSMQIRLSLNNEQAAVSFVVSNPQAKEALEAALPRLREMLEQQGMQLADSDVKQGDGQSTGDQSGDSEQGVKANGMDGEPELEEQAQVLAQMPKSPWSVDYYA